MKALTVFLSLVVACGLGYSLGLHHPRPQAPRCRCCPQPMPPVGCDCGEGCGCEGGERCVRPARCPNVHGLPAPSIN